MVNIVLYPPRTWIASSDTRITHLAVSIYSQPAHQIFDGNVHMYDVFAINVVGTSQQVPERLFQKDVLPCMALRIVQEFSQALVVHAPGQDSLESVLKDAKLGS